MPLAFYLDFATKQKGLRQAIDSKGLLSPNIVSLFCRPLPPSDNKGKDSAAIKQILHSYFIECTNLESPIMPKSNGDEAEIIYLSDVRNPWFGKPIIRKR